MHLTRCPFLEWVFLIILVTVISKRPYLDHSPSTIRRSRLNLIHSESCVSSNLFIIWSVRIGCLKRIRAALKRIYIDQTVKIIVLFLSWLIFRPSHGEHLFTILSYLILLSIYSSIVFRANLHSYDMPLVVFFGVFKRLILHEVKCTTYWVEIIFFKCDGRWFYKWQDHLYTVSRC